MLNYQCRFEDAYVVSKETQRNTEFPLRSSAWLSQSSFSWLFIMGFTDIAIVAAVEIFGDFQLRWYAQTNLLKHLVQGIAGYIAVVFFLIRSFRSDNVLYVNSVWDGLSSIIESVAAYYYLGDRLKSTHQYLGLVMTIVGVILLKTG